MWHFNEDSYEKRRRKSLFYTTVEAETLLQKNVRVRLWHLTIVPFLVFIKRYFLLLGFRDGVAGWILAFEGMASTFDAYRWPGSAECILVKKLSRGLSRKTEAA
jgi:hypothetical protein